MGQMIEGRLLANGQAVRLCLKQGRVASIEALSTSESLPILAPGLVDIQVNGFGGVDYNGEGLDERQLRASAHALWQQGTTTFLPTLITNSVGGMSRLLSNLVRARVGDLAASIPGYHLEGPWISSEDGPRGAHDARHVQAPCLDAWAAWQRAAEGCVRLLTLSPEWPGAGAVIQQLVWDGVRVAIGHTAASPEQIADAVRSGASLSTHLGNGSHLTLPRHRNYLWSQLADDRLWASIIADGFHLPVNVLRVFLRVKGSRAIVTSDATALAGMPPGEYTTPVGGRVRLTPSGKLHLADNDQLLAGSAQSQLFALSFLDSEGLLSFRESWPLASLHPARYLGLYDRGEIGVGKRADIVLLDPVTKEIIATWVAGNCMYQI